MAGKAKKQNPPRIDEGKEIGKKGGERKDISKYRESQWVNSRIKGDEETTKKEKS